MYFSSIEKVSESILILCFWFWGAVHSVTFSIFSQKLIKFLISSILMEILWLWINNTML